MEFLGYIVAGTARAILFQDHFWHEPDWMPRSQIHITDDFDSNEVHIKASPWICQQKNIHEFKERQATS